MSHRRGAGSSLAAAPAPGRAALARGVAQGRGDRAGSPGGDGQGGEAAPGALSHLHGSVEGASALLGLSRHRVAASRAGLLA